MFKILDHLNVNNLNYIQKLNLNKEFKNLFKDK